MGIIIIDGRPYNRRDGLDRISALDLRTEAEVATERGETVEVHTGRDGRGQVVTTLVLGDRAGQCTGAGADWGDWDFATLCVHLDAGMTVDLDGHAVSDE